jgi:hypothetical protein
LCLRVRVSQELSVCPCVCVSACHKSCLSVLVSSCPRVTRAVCLSLCLRVRVSFVCVLCPFEYRRLPVLIYLSIYRRQCLSIYKHQCLSIYLSIYRRLPVLIYLSLSVTGRDCVWISSCIVHLVMLANVTGLESSVT